jgi:hypothetical protein
MLHAFYPGLLAPGHVSSNVDLQYNGAKHTSGRYWQYLMERIELCACGIVRKQRRSQSFLLFPPWSARSWRSWGKETRRSPEARSCGEVRSCQVRGQALRCELKHSDARNVCARSRRRADRPVDDARNQRIRTGLSQMRPTEGSPHVAVPYNATYLGCIFGTSMARRTGVFPGADCRTR